MAMYSEDIFGIEITDDIKTIFNVNDIDSYEPILSFLRDLFDCSEYEEIKFVDRYGRSDHKVYFGTVGDSKEEDYQHIIDNFDDYFNSLITHVKFIFDDEKLDKEFSKLTNMSKNDNLQKISSLKNHVLSKSPQHMTIKDKS